MIQYLHLFIQLLRKVYITYHLMTDWLITNDFQLHPGAQHTDRSLHYDQRVAHHQWRCLGRFSLTSRCTMPSGLFYTALQITVFSKQPCSTLLLSKSPGSTSLRQNILLFLLSSRTLCGARHLATTHEYREIGTHQRGISVFLVIPLIWIGSPRGLLIILVEWSLRLSVMGMGVLIESSFCSLMTTTLILYVTVDLLEVQASDRSSSSKGSGE